LVKVLQVLALQILLVLAFLAAAVVQVVELVVLQLFHNIKVALAEHTVAAVVKGFVVLLADLQVEAQVLKEPFVLFGPDQLVNSHQLVLVYHN
jgi:hypothetical protein